MEPGALEWTVVMEIDKNFGLKPGMIVQELSLTKPTYSCTACYRHL